MSVESHDQDVDILLVDDEPANLLALRAVLAGPGRNLVEAGSGEEALARMLAGDFAVVLLDVVLPGISGFETARLIRGRQRSKATPIIFLTACEGDPAFSLDEAFALGAVDCLIKPFPPAMLGAKVEGLVDLHRRSLAAVRAESEAREYLEKVLSSVSDLFLMLDRELRLTYVNDRMVDASGIPREDLVGRRLQEVFPDTPGTLLESELRRAIDGGTPVHFEFYHASHGRWFDNRAFPHRGGLMLVATEVTERRRAEEVRNHLAAIVESSGDAIISEDLGGIITSWNDAARRLLGFEAAEALGRHISLLAPEGQDDTDLVLERIGRGEPVEHHETRRRRKDGEILDVSLSVSPVRDAAGRVIGASKIVRDIGDRKRAEGRLRLLAEAGKVLSSSLDYETTLANVCELVVPGLADWCSIDLVLGGGGDLRRIHVAHKDPAKVEMARDLRRRFPPRADAASGLARVLRTGEPELVREVTDEMLARAARDAEHLGLLRDLGLRSAIIVPLKAGGSILGALTLVTSDSPRRLTEADLGLAQELASRAALAVENARLFAEAHGAIRARDEAIVLHRSMEHQLSLLVDASTSLSESLEPGAVLGAVLALSRRLVPADAYAVWRYRPESGRWGIEEASGLSERYRRESVEVADRVPSMPDRAIVAADVRESPALGRRAGSYDAEGIRSMMCVPLRIRGPIAGTLAFYFRTPHDFSDVEVRVGTALANLAGSAIGTSELYQELREAGRLKDEFLAMLGHELRNPLAAVGNALAAAARGGHREHVDWAIDVTTRQMRQLGRLVDDLLDVSRISRGKVELRRAVVDLAQVLDGAVAAARPLAEQRGHTLEVSIQREGLWADADPVRIEQVVVNLLSNAAKYSEDGGHIRLAARSEGDEVVVTVEDRGVGIPPEMLPRMFELFAQGDRSLARSEGGLGIGLTVVKGLVELHGGRVQARSEGVGRGCEFSVRLPKAARPPEASRAEGLPPAGGGGRARVLVVDDVEDVARGMARLLKLLGHDVEVAHSGPEAIELARVHRPDVVLLDIGLPGMDGYELASRLRREAGCGGAIIAAVTGYGQESDRLRSREAGIDHHLVKPVDPDALISLLSR